jgi:hypothetical protein
MQGRNWKLAMLLATTVGVMAGASSLVLAQSTARDPDIARQEPKGLRDPDVARQEPKGLRDPDIARQEPKGLRDPDAERQEPKGLKDSAPPK